MIELISIGAFFIGIGIGFYVGRYYEDAIESQGDRHYGDRHNR